MRASLFWYHPHVRSNEQVEKGLYGALLVHDPAENAALALPETEHILVLDDVLVQPNGEIADPFPADPLDNAITQVNGRAGNVLLVNGLVDPEPHVRRGVPLRLRIVNASNTRFMRVSIPGHRMHRIGGDGGLLEAPIPIDPVEVVADPHNPGAEMSDPDPSKGLLLTPGERADVVFTPATGKIPVEWHDFPRGRHSAFYLPDGSIGLGHAHMDGRLPSETLLTLKTTASDSNGGYVPPAALRTIPAVDTGGATPITSLFGHTPPNAGGDITFFAQMKNGMPLPFNSVTPSDAPTLSVGDTAIWEVHNLTAGHHNFHLHGFTFQLIETQFIDMDTPDNNGVVPAPFLEDKDTIFLPRRTGAKGRSRTIIRLAVRIDDAGREGQVEASGKVPGVDTSGGWLFHCHLLEHAARGMMSFLQVVD